MRYIYSLPAERIVKLFTENGFELEKTTAHGLISKTSLLLDQFEQVLRRAIHSDPYIRLDETYYNVINEEKNEKGKAVRKETDTYPHATRIACVQHAKRKFLDLENDKQAQDIVRTINRLYQIEHEMLIENGYVTKAKVKWWGMGSYANPYLWKENKSDLEYKESWNDPRLPETPKEEQKPKQPIIQQKNRGRKR